MARRRPIKTAAIHTAFNATAHSTVPNQPHDALSSRQKSKCHRLHQSARDTESRHKSSVPFRSLQLQSTICSETNGALKSNGEVQEENPMERVSCNFLTMFQLWSFQAQESLQRWCGGKPTRRCPYTLQGSRSTRSKSRKWYKWPRRRRRTSLLRCLVCRLLQSQLRWPMCLLWLWPPLWLVWPLRCRNDDSASAIAAAAAAAAAAARHGGSHGVPVGGPRDTRTTIVPTCQPCVDFAGTRHVGPCSKSEGSGSKKHGPVPSPSNPLH
jgi:hypothetical protein